MVARLTYTHLETTCTTGSIWAYSPWRSTLWGRLGGCCWGAPERTCRCRQDRRKDWAVLMSPPCSTPPTQAVWTGQKWSWRGFTPWLTRTEARLYWRSARRQVLCSWVVTVWSRYQVESLTVMAARYLTAMWVFLHCNSLLPPLPHQLHSKVGPGKDAQLKNCLFNFINLVVIFS